VKHCNQNKLRAFTLIELLVTMIVSSVIVLVVSGMYAGVIVSREKAIEITDLSNTSFTLSTAVEMFMRQAGYRGLQPTRIGTGNASPVLFKEQSFSFIQDEWQEGQFVSANGDEISFRFSGSSDEDGNIDGTIFDCTGTPIGVDTIETITLAVTNSELICTSTAGTEVLAGSSSGAGIEQFVVELGIDDNNDLSADRYVSGSAASDSDLLAVSAVRLIYLLASGDNVSGSSEDYWFNGASYSSSDRKERRELVVHVALRHN